jgi:tRNA A-37 threonylcarbamoyl transferase component Bud32
MESQAKSKNQSQINFMHIFSELQTCYKFIKSNPNWKLILTEYFGYCFQDLAQEPSNEDESYKLFSLTQFSAYLDLPILISEKIFKIFNRSGKGYLTELEFIEGMIKLYFGSLHEILEVIFNIFLFDDLNEGQKLTIFEINFQDVLLIMKIISQEGEDEENRKFAEALFNQDIERSLDFMEFEENIKNVSSDILIKILSFIYNRQPFTLKSLKFFEENSNWSSKSRRGSKTPSRSRSPSPIKREASNKMIQCLSYHLDFIKAPKYKNNKFIPDQEDEFSFNYVDQLKIFKPISLSNSNSSTAEYQDDPYTNTSPANSTPPINKKVSEYKIIIIDNNLFSFEKTLIEKETKTKNGNIKLTSQYILSSITPLQGRFFTNLGKTEISGDYFYVSGLVETIGIKPAKNSHYYLFEEKYENEDFCNKYILKNAPKCYEIRDIKNYYEFLDSLGKGNYARVWLARRRKDSRKYAVKVLIKTNFKDKEQLEKLHYELDIIKFLMRNYDNNVCKAIDIFEDVENLYIVLEYIYCVKYNAVYSIGNLIAKKTLNEKLIQSTMKQIAEGISFLHKNAIIHRDLKPENILIETREKKDKLQYIPKIVDFGFAKFLKGKSKESYGTLFYAAPELILKESYDHKVDVWSFGIILFEAVTGIIPFDRKGFDSTEMAKFIVNEPLPQIVEEFEPELKKLVLGCLDKDPNRRFTIEQVLESKWFLNK